MASAIDKVLAHSVHTLQFLILIKPAFRQEWPLMNVVSLGISREISTASSGPGRI